MGLFSKPSLEETRLQTYTTIYDIVEKMKKLQAKATRDKFIEYLQKLQDEFRFSVNNNKQIPMKYEKRLFGLLQEIDNLLAHELWNGNRIKRRLETIEDLKRDIL